MTRYLALAFATIGCACTSLPTTATTDVSSPSMVQSLDAQAVSLADGADTKSTVPMDTEGRKERPLDTLARTLHVYWFFGSR